MATRTPTTTKTPDEPPAEELPPVPVLPWNQAHAALYGYTHPYKLAGGNWQFVPQYDGEPIMEEVNAGGGWDTLDKALVFTHQVQVAGGPQAYRDAQAAAAQAAADAAAPDPAPTDTVPADPGAGAA